MEQPPSQGGKRRETNDMETDRERVQRFQFGPWVFNVNQAQAIVAQSPRDPKLLPVEQWARFYGLDNDASRGFSLFTPLPSFSRDYAMAADLNDPVLVATLRNQEGTEFPLLIDGIHRLYRAFAERIAELPAYVLTAEESLAIREDGLTKPSVTWPGYDRNRLPGNSAEPGNGGGS